MTLHQSGEPYIELTFLLNGGGEGKGEDKRPDNISEDSLWFPKTLSLF